MVESSVWLVGVREEGFEEGGEEDAGEEGSSLKKETSKIVGIV